MHRDVIMIDTDAAEKYGIKDLPEIMVHGHGKECMIVRAVFGVAIAGCVISMLGAGTMVMVIKRRDRESRMMEDMVKQSMEGANMRDQRWEPMRGKRNSEDGASRMAVRQF